MAFQLLTFFVFTYHPSALEGQMELTLPAAGEAQAAKPEDVDPSKAPDTDLEVPSELTVVVKTRQDGVIDGAPFQYLVEAREGTTPPMSTLKELEDYLVRAKEGLSNKDDVKIKADSHLKYAFVVQIMDVCHNPKKGGFKRVGFAPPPDRAGGS
jgi:biopolymer transport protein ExbD